MIRTEIRTCLTLFELPGDASQAFPPTRWERSGNGKGSPEGLSTQEGRAQAGLSGPCPATRNCHRSQLFAVPCVNFGLIAGFGVKFKQSPVWRTGSMKILSRIFYNLSSPWNRIVTSRVQCPVSLSIGSLLPRMEKSTWVGLLVRFFGKTITPKNAQRHLSKQIHVGNHFARKPMSIHLHTEILTST